MDYIAALWTLLPSTSALDRWSDRAIRIASIECIYPLVLVIVASSYFPKPSEFEYDHPPMTKIKLAVAVPTIFFPLASSYGSWISTRRQVRVRNTLLGKPASTRAPVKPLIYSSFQILQLIACSWVAAYDFVRLSARSPWFWFSLVGGLMPALAGTIYGFVGIVRFLFTGPAHLALHRYRSPTAGEEYSDDVIEHCALERAYQQQLPDNAPDPELVGAVPADGYQATAEGIPLSQLEREETTFTRPRNNQHPKNNATTQKPDTSQTPAPDDQIRSPHRIIPPTQPRFRWQVQSGVHNGGAPFWGPIAAMSSLISIWAAYYRWLIRNGNISLQLVRLLALEAFAPIGISVLSSATLTFSLYRPLFALIFTAFCFTVLASAVWFAEFVYSVWCFFYYMRQISAGSNLASFAMILVAFAMTWCHLALVRCSVKMEWTGTLGCSSLLSEFRLWKERRQGGAGADYTEVTQDEEI